MKKAVQLALLASLALPGVGCRGTRGLPLVPPPAEPVGSGVLTPGWRVQLHPTAWQNLRPQMFAQPVTDDLSGALYVGTSDGVFRALDMATGGERWSYGPVGPIASQPLLMSFERRLYVGSEDGRLHCLNSRTGQKRWVFSSKGPIQAAPMEARVAGRALLFVTNADDHLYALSPETGELVWEAQRERPDQFTVQGHSGPLVVGDKVLVGFSGGFLAAYQAASGKLAWETDLSDGRSQFVDIDTTPLLDPDGKVVYVSSAATGVFAVAVDSGDVKWNVPTEGAGAITQERERLYVSAPGELVMLSRAGEVIKRASLGRSGDAGRSVIVGPYLMLPLADAGLAVLDKDSGQLLEFFDPGPGVTAPPAVSEGRLFALSNGGILYQFSIAK